MRFMMTYSKIKQLTIKAILEYIEEHIGVKPIDIETIVCFSGYSRRYLQTLFKSCMGVPIGRYIQLRRVSRAAVLLRLTSLPLVSIAGKLCYDSQQTFSREFKKTQAIHHCSIERAIYGPSRTLRDQRTCQLLCQNPNFVTLMKKIQRDAVIL
ncbi:helix-turn-helix domain-containing protein [Escherichia coli]|nr:helix-turn-helix domain-containing protein [Escherichia coli]MDW9207197.1 helix-turn-helix domain-containing protein [Escherichia coli]